MNECIIIQEGGVIMINIGQIVLDNFRKNFEITENDIGSDAVLKKSMMKFVTRTYDIKDYGHLCVMNMEGMLGLMKMETVILVPLDRDVPLVDFDYISAMGKETYIAEFYRYMLKEYPEEYVSELAKCPEQYPELGEYNSGEHWYDSEKYYCSCGKTGKKSADKFTQITRAYMDTFCKQVVKMEKCDREAKTAEIRRFTETLVAKGGPAVDTFKKMFGEEMTRRIVLENMYGLKRL